MDPAPCRRGPVLLRGSRVLGDEGFVVFWGMGFGGKAARRSRRSSRESSRWSREPCRPCSTRSTPACNFTLTTQRSSIRGAGNKHPSRSTSSSCSGSPSGSSSPTRTAGVGATSMTGYVGILYSMPPAGGDGEVLTQVLPHYTESVRRALAPLACRSGTVPLAEAHTAVGKAGRVAQVVPEAAPFAGSLWAALADSQRAAVQGKRDALPGRVACVRFAAAAAWFLALLDGAVLPLQRRLYAYSADEVHPAGDELCFDASPWGYSAAKTFKGKIVAYTAGVWDEATIQLSGR